MKVHFIGEAGLGGGLLFDFYTSFFDDLLATRQDMFESPMDAVFLPRAGSTELVGTGGLCSSRHHTHFNPRFLS
jgi:hypothetical protein